MNDGKRLQSNFQTTLGRYTLLRKIGSGGMGDVWLAEDPVLRRQIAIKTLPLHSQRDSEYLQRFAREARAAATLNHPHILLVHDYGEQALADGQSITYIVMPFVAGDTLSDQIALYASRNMLMPAEEALSYLAQAAEAIDYAHTQGIIHRDIKPKNMLLREDHWLLLSDFGIARILTDREQLTQTGVGFGTAEYMAPEQAQGRAAPASDIYSLAVIAYQLFTGQLPFTADTPYAITIQHMTLSPPSLRQFNPALPLALEQVILRGLARDPAQRPPSAQAFVAALRAAYASGPVAGSASMQPGMASAVPALPATRPVFAEGTTRVAGGQPTKGLSRRTVLAGGALFVLAGSSLGIWAITHHAGETGAGMPQGTATATTTKKVTPAPDPNGPSLVLLSHNQPVSSLAWSPQAATLVSAGPDGKVLQWNIAGVAPGTRTVTRPDIALQDVGNNMLLAWSPDASLLAVGNVTAPAFDTSHLSAYATIYTGNLNSAAPGFPNPVAIPNSLYISALAWTPARYCALAVNKANAETQLVFAGPALKGQLTTPVSLPIDLTGQSGFFPSTLAYSPDGTKLAMGAVEGAALASVAIQGTTAHVRLLSTLQINDSGAEIDAVSWSPGGQYLAGMNINSGDGPGSTVVAWNVADGTRRHLGLPDSAVIVQTLAWSPAPASTLLAAGGQDGKVYVWDISGNALPLRTLNGLPAAVQALAWSKDGRWIAAGYQDRNSSILLWKM